MKIFNLVSNFTKEFAKHVKGGAKVVSPKQYEKRLKTCNDCPHFMYISKRCGNSATSLFWKVSCFKK